MAEAGESFEHIRHDHISEYQLVLPGFQRFKPVLVERPESELEDDRDVVVFMPPLKARLA